MNNEQQDDQRDTMIVYRSFYESIKELPKANQAEVWEAVFELGFNFNEIALKGLSLTVFRLMAPIIRKNIAQFKNGKKPKDKPMQDQRQAKDYENASQHEAKGKPNVSQSEAYKDKDKDKEVDKDEDKDNEIGAGGLFHEKIIAFIDAYGSAGNRHDTERKYIEAITTLKGDGWPENNAHKMLIEKAAQYRVFRIQTQRKPKDPANWLKDRTWTTDYVQELENFKIENAKNIGQNGKSNGNPPKTAARAYTDAARNHVEWIESQIED